jgi:hypothetical protein
VKERIGPLWSALIGRTRVLAARLDWHLLTLIGLWLLCHPYRGIVHDARIYAAQSLRVFNPKAFQGDLFFEFGSQASFTIFPMIWATLIGWYGLSVSSILLVAAGQFLWLSGAIVAALTLLGKHDRRYWVLVSLVIIPGYYGGFYVFQTGEGFVTASLFAEAATLWSIHFSRRSPALALLLVLTSGLLHPLYGLVGALFVIIAVGQLNWRWITLCNVGLGAVAALGWAGIEPFDRLGKTMDAEWYSIVVAKDALSLPAEWPLSDHFKLLFEGILVALAIPFVPRRSRRFWIGAVMIGWVGVAASVIASTILSNVLLTQLQFYRGTWLLHLFASLSLGILAWECLDRGRIGRTAFALLIAALLWLPFPAPIVIVPIGMSTVGLGWVLLHPAPRISIVVEALAINCLIATAVMVLGTRAWRIATNFMSGWSISPNWAWETLSLQPIDIGVVDTVMLFWASHARKAWPRVRWGLVIFLLLAGGLTCDRRSDWGRELESGHSLAVVRKLIPRDATVYWEELTLLDQGMKGPWIGLHRSSYFSSGQGSGAMFNRATASNFRDRLRELVSIDGRVMSDFYGAPAQSPEIYQDISSDDIDSACTSALGLDFLILTRYVPARGAVEWRPDFPPLDSSAIVPGAELLPTDRIFIYDCRTIRRDATS